MIHLKKIPIVLLLIILANSTNAQSVAQGINYQAIAEDATGNPVTNQSIGIKISIYSGSSTGILVWEETHSATTNQFGLFSLVIGQGFNTGNGAAANFSSINWGSANHYLKVSMDITGGASYIDMDNSQLLSVPYALYSLKSGATTNPISINNLLDADTTGTSIGKTLKWDGNLWKPAKDNNSDTALYAYTAKTAQNADTAMYATTATIDTALFAYKSDTSNYSNTSNLAKNANSSMYSDTAYYALNCANNNTNDWHLTGNIGIVAPTNFIGTTNASDLVIKTNNIERLRMTSAGKLGMGTTTPTASIHFVGNDGLISEGTFGSGTAQSPGFGTRMMWYPKKAAFRAGYINAAQWDDANIGNYSYASGYSTTAKGIGAVAMGQSCSAGDSCSVAMGYMSNASGKYAVAMGNSPVASGYAGVALGRGTTASGYASSSIGYHAIASGDMSTAFGYYTTASGNNSVAMGYRSNTNNMTGSFVFADNSSTNVQTYATAPNQFMVKASGGTIFYSNSALTSGVSLAAGGGAWLTVSDKKRKEHFNKMDGETVLKKIAELEITSWNYKTQASSIRHLGPMAQDLYEAFQLGESDSTITTTDIDGINMLAIQALEKRTVELNKKTEELEQLKKQVSLLANEKALLEKRLLFIERKLQKKADNPANTSEN